MVRSLVAICLLLVFAGFIGTQVVAQSNSSEVRMQFVPATNTTALTDAIGIQIIRIMLSNTSGTAVTCNIRDKGTGCGGSPCQWWPNITVDANALQTLDGGNVLSVGGVDWSCSTGNVVIGTIIGRR